MTVWTWFMHRFWPAPRARRAYPTVQCAYCQRTVATSALSPTRHTCVECPECRQMGACLAACSVQRQWGRR